MTKSLRERMRHRGDFVKCANEAASDYALSECTHTEKLGEPPEDPVGVVDCLECPSCSATGKFKYLGGRATFPTSRVAFYSEDGDVPPVLKQELVSKEDTDYYWMGCSGMFLCTGCGSSFSISLCMQGGFVFLGVVTS